MFQDPTPRELGRRISAPIRPPTEAHESLHPYAGLLQPDSRGAERDDSALPSRASSPKIHTPGLLNPSRMLLSLGKRLFFERVLRGDADFEYFRRYGNGVSHFAPLNGKVHEELAGMFRWLNTSECNVRVLYGAGLCVLGERDTSGRFRYQRIHPAPVFAKTVLEYYRHSSREIPEIQRALGDVETFFEQSGRVDYQAAAWWLLSTMVDRRSDSAELVKALGECTAMTLVARTLDTNHPLERLVVKAAKEKPIIEGEALIPSFDFRVHRVRPSIFSSVDTPLAFFEVKRVQSLRSVNDITSVVRSTVTNKIEKPYPERDGSMSVLENHPGLKVLVIQAPWPTAARPFEFRSKGQVHILSEDGSMERSFERGGQVRLQKSGNMFESIAAKLAEIRGAEKLDAVFLTDHSGRLIQTFYHYGDRAGAGMLLKSPRPVAPVKWRNEGTRLIDRLSYQ